MKVEEAFRFPFQDKGLERLLIGGLVTIIPIVNIASAGYFVEVMERINNGNYEMPSWSGFGGKFLKGLGNLVIALFYGFIPLLIVAAGAAGSYRLSGNGMLLPVFGGLVSTIGFLLLLAAWFIIPMSVARYASTGLLGEGFRVSRVLQYIRAVLGQYAGVCLLSIVLYFVASLVSGIIPILGFIISAFLTFYVMVVTGFLFGEAHREAESVLSTGVGSIVK
ncbi:MAG TPA: DUF4013 domain-containing protein [Desulfotomaculum sp.]|nr:DUF4013 domain-containing protein [Desulfotomaculum sp.]